MADLTSSSIVESAVIEASHITALYDTFTGTTTYDNISIIGTASYATTASYAENVVTSSQETTQITIKNVSTGTIAKGTPCYITGSGTSGNIAGVVPADAQSASLMPAGVIAAEELTAGSEGAGIVIGFISGVNTSGFAAGDNVYVAVGGGYTNVKPTGSTNLIQKLGNVEKVDASNGSGVILGAGRTNDLPNIKTNFLWVGNSDGVATATNGAPKLDGSYIPSGSATTSSGAFTLFVGGGKTDGVASASLIYPELIGKTGIGSDVFISATTSTTTGGGSDKYIIFINNFDNSTGELDIRTGQADTDFSIVGYYI